MVRFLSVIAFALFSQIAFSQSVPFPPLPNSSTNFQPWGYEQVGTTWNTAAYLPFIYQNRWFRLLPPNGVTYNRSTNTWTFSEGTKKYPLILFFHGRGEQGTDNNAQLKHGGQRHLSAVQSGHFPGYCLYPQSATIQQAKAMVDKMIRDFNVDPDRIYVHGLSNGGSDTWKYLITYPTEVAAGFPMSASDDLAKTENLLYMPIRQAQGGLDTNPAPHWTQTIVDWFNNNGGHLEYFFLPTVGHGTWNNMYNRSDFFTWFLAQKKNQIMVRFKRNELCPNETVSVVLGLTPGFAEYRWYRDGVLIPNSNTFKITATQYGSYTAQFRRASTATWSDVSAPVEVKIKAATQTPPIQLSQLQSVVIPDINGNSSVGMTLPSGYETYTWNRTGQAGNIGTTQSIIVSSVGSYTATVKEFGGCSSLPSQPLVVVDANGPLKPDVVSNVIVTTVSKTELRINWENNITPTVNETGFEVYRSTSSNGVYQLLAVTGPDVLTYSDKNLQSNVQFWYRIRPVTGNGAAAASVPVSGITDVDSTPPTAPNNLTVTSVSPTSVGLSWNGSTDDVGVVGYDVMVRPAGQQNYVRAYVTTGTSQTVFQLTPNTLYNFVVVARDAAGNQSQPSQQAIQATVFQGLNYSYYHGQWSMLPNFSSLTPVATGTTSNFTIAPRLQNDNFGFVFTGTIHLPSTGQYTFFLTSDDGSKIWVNNTLVVDHDGIHGSSEKSGRITLAAGFYPIRVEYFERTGSGERLEVRWQGPSIGKQLIPNFNLRENFAQPTPPATPANPTLTVLDYQSIRVNWGSYSGTGTNIEVFRSLNNSTWNIIATVPSTQVNFTDTRLNPSTRYHYRIRAISSGNISAFTTSVNATTTALPPLPIAPSNLQMVTVSPNSTTISWSDNSTNEDNFEVWKSIGNNSNYIRVGNLPPNTTSFTDNSLFAHTDYFYRVNARNVRGASGNSNELQVTSTNNPPVLAEIANVRMRFANEFGVSISAADVDNDFLVFSGSNLPSFAQLYDYGDGTAVVYFTPQEADMGDYSNIRVTVMDQFGGVHFREFSLTVNSNHAPVISAVDPIAAFRESYVAKVNITATDQDNDIVTWTFQNAPAFMAPVINGNSLDLTFKPGLSHAGNYSLTVTATDGDGATDTEIISFTVQDFDPNFAVQVNFRRSVVSPPGWNGVGPFNNANTTFPLNRQLGGPSGISLVVDGPWGGDSDINGVTPGAYANDVNASFWFHQSAPARNLRLTGMNPDGKYNIRLLASRILVANDNNNRLTRFSIAGHAPIDIQANGNASNLAIFNSVTPNSQGEIVVSVELGAGATFALLNAMVIESFYDGNFAPPAPSALAAAIQPGTSAIRLTWTDNASNEMNYQVFRSTDNVNFTSLATLPLDAVTYTDNSFQAGIMYFYRVRATNGVGNSDFSNTVSIVGANRGPLISPLTTITQPENEMRVVAISATDPDGDFMDFFLENEPHFVWVEYVDNGKANLMVAPSVGDNGNYSFNLLCQDDKGATSSTPVNLVISSVNEKLFRINFTVAGVTVPAPWNNVVFTPNVALSLNNLRDNNNTVTGVSISVPTPAWGGTNANGFTSGNNSAVFPDNAMSNSFFIQDNTARAIVLSGLDPAKIYDFSFFASRMLSGSTEIRNTQYTIAGRTAVVNALNNTSNLAQIQGIKPTAGGQITVTVLRPAGSSFAYLNAMVMREYNDVGVPPTPAPPVNLTSQVLTRNSIRLNWSDASDNETAFEVFRSVGTNANFVLVGTVGPNVTTFTNTSLSTSTKYFYRVRAINAAGQSNFSNETTASTFDFSVSVNFDSFYGNEPGWNNLLTWLPTGSTVPNLTDELGVNTGITMTVVSEFASDNHFGMNTGNNSGVVPDRVMRGMWWIDRLGTATLRFSNLSFLRKYNFSFFGSRDGAGDRTTVYMINGQSVSLNATFNTQNIVQIKDILPDANGTITVEITTTATALFGYLNGLIIQAVPNTGDSGGAGARVASRVQDVKPAQEIVEMPKDIAGYPNPFVDRIVVTLNDKVTGKFRLSMMNAAGNVIFDNGFTRDENQNEVEVNLRPDISPGAYFIRLVAESGYTQTVKLLRK